MGQKQAALLFTFLFLATTDALACGKIFRCRRQPSVCGRGGCNQLNVDDNFLDPFQDNLDTFNLGLNGVLDPTLSGLGSTGLGTSGLSQTFDPALLGSVGGGTGVPGVVDPTGSSGSLSPIGQTGSATFGGLQPHFGRRAQVFRTQDNRFIETSQFGNRTVRFMDFQSANGSLVFNPQTGQFVTPFRGQLVIDTGTVSNGRRVMVPASIDSVRFVLGNIINDARRFGVNRLSQNRQLILAAYRPLMNQVFSDSPQQPTAPTTTPSPVTPGTTPPPPTGGSHDVQPISTGHTTAPGAAGESKFIKWWKSFNNAKDVDKNKIQDEVKALATVKTAEGKPWSVKVLNQNCASSTKPDTEIPMTTYVFSSTVDGKTTTHIAIDPKRHVEDSTEHIESAWKAAKTKDQSGQERGLALTPDGMDPNSLVSAFSITPPVAAPNHTEEQVQLRPVVGENGITDFATRIVIKHKDGLGDNRWKKSDGDIVFYCKTIQAAAAAPKPTTPTPPPSDATKDTATAALRATAASVVAAKCVSCHKEGNAKGGLRLDGDNWNNPETLDSMLGRIDETDEGIRMPLDKGPLPKAERDALAAYLAELKKK